MPKRKNSEKLTSSKAKRPRDVPFARGFKLPTTRQARQAIGAAPLEPEYDPLDSFQPLPKPVYDLDWLAGTVEEGQPYSEFLRYSSWYSKTKSLKTGTCQFNVDGVTISEKYPNGKIYLLPLGDFGDALNLDDIAEYTRLFYGLPVIVLEKIPTKLERGTVVAVKRTGEQVALTTRYDRSTGRFQCRVDSGLNDLTDAVPTDSLFVVMVTLIDLYCDKSDLFVAGIGSIWRKMGIFSFNRYDPALTFSEEKWYEREIDEQKMKPNKRKSLLMQRSCKLLVHEIAHIFGIGHCVYFACVMNGSGNIWEDFRQPHHLCPVDLHKIRALCGFDVISRYEALGQFYGKHGMSAEATWVKSRVQTIHALRDKAGPCQPADDYIGKLRPK